MSLQLSLKRSSPTGKIKHFAWFTTRLDNRCRYDACVLQQIVAQFFDFMWLKLFYTIFSHILKPTRSDGTSVRQLVLDNSLKFVWPILSLKIHTFVSRLDWKILDRALLTFYRYRDYVLPEIASDVISVWQQMMSVCANWAVLKKVLNYSPSSLRFERTNKDPHIMRIRLWRLAKKPWINSLFLRLTPVRRLRWHVATVSWTEVRHCQPLHLLWCDALLLVWLVLQRLRSTSKDKLINKSFLGETRLE